MAFTCPTICAMVSTSLRNLASEQDSAEDKAVIIELAEKLEAAADVGIETQNLLMEAWEICYSPCQ